jgi:hypothetical protein
MPWMSAALWWLTTAPGPIRVSAAAALTACPPARSRDSAATRSAGAYSPCPNRTKAPRRTRRRSCPRDTPTAASSAAVITPANRDEPDIRGVAIQPESPAYPTFHTKRSLCCPICPVCPCVSGDITGSGTPTQAGEGGAGTGAGAAGGGGILVGP